MKSLVRPELPTASVGSSQAPTAAVDNSAPLANRTESSTYKSGNAVQTSGATSVWAGPNCHLVHYPLRGGQQYNLVVTFHSREQEEWGVKDGSPEEVHSYFQGIHDRPRQLLDLPKSWKRWSTADREPIATWSQGRATVLGDAAHPMMQYLAQGACMAMEDAVTLGEALRTAGFDLVAAFKLYQEARVARAARVVLSVREMGRLYHAAGVERLVRNSLWTGRTPERYYDALEWLYGWRPENCLADAARTETARQEAASAT